MGWPIGVTGLVFAVLAFALLAVAVWQVIQIVRWPEGRALTNELDRVRRDEPVTQGVTKRERS